MNAAAKSSIVTKNVRSYIGTLNNPDLNTKEFLSDFHNLSKAVYTCGQLEIGENGTPHIQFAVHFKNARSIKSIKSLCPRAHFESSNSRQRYRRLLHERDKGRRPHSIRHKANKC